MQKIYYGFFALVVVGLFVVLWLAGRPPIASADVVALAQCLRDRGITMYGAEWCPHCKNEKKAFGSAFDFVPYVECPIEKQRCAELKIEGYPTWIFPDGKRLVGEQGITKLQEESGCASSTPGV